MLLIVVFPYLLKAYNGYLENKEQKKTRKIQEKIELQRQLTYNENQEKKKLLTKYNITVLNTDYSCRSEDECPIEIKIPKEIFNYLFGEFKDIKLNSNDQCKKYKNKYIKYCPDDPFGFCGLQISEPTSSPSYFLTEDLKGKGFDLTLLPINNYQGDSFGMGKCNRLNFESKFQEFNKELPNIKKMIAENKSNIMIKIFNERFYKNYILLQNELKNE